MARISAQLREQVVERARGRCEYCQTQQAIVVSMQIDHVVPQASGGSTGLDNLCLACVGCNGYKLSFETGVDPDTGAEVQLFNPRTQDWSDHFSWPADGLRLEGRTPAGRATIDRLRINRDAMVSARRRWVAAGWHPPR